MKKLICISAISFLLISLASCYTNKTLTSQKGYYSCLKIKDGQYVVNSDFCVINVITRQKDTIIFNINNPGRVTGTGVYGFPEKRFLFSDAIESISFTNQSVQYKTIKFIWKNGEKFDFIKQDSLGYVCLLPESITIPFSNIEKIQVKKENAKIIGWTIAGVGIVGAITLFIYMIYTWSQSG